MPAVNPRNVVEFIKEFVAKRGGPKKLAWGGAKFMGAQTAMMIPWLLMEKVMGSPAGEGPGTGMREGLPGGLPFDPADPMNMPFLGQYNPALYRTTGR